MTLGLENLDGKRLSKPQSLYARDPYLYMCDTGNNRILEIERKGNSFSVSRIINEMKGRKRPPSPSPMTCLWTRKGISMLRITETSG